MADSQPADGAQSAPVVLQERVVIRNGYGEKLVGVLHETGSGKLVVLCHGFRSSKDESIIGKLALALTQQRISVFRFDFSGNGESEGSFEYGNFRKEAEDLNSAVRYLAEKEYNIIAVVGHSKGGNVVLLYASVYHDVPKVINLSGRFNLHKGIKERFGAEFFETIKKDGFFDVKDKSGNVLYRITEASLVERLNTDMHAASLSIDKKCRVLTVHGSSDEIIPVEDALEFAKIIPNHELRIVDGADHCYRKHEDELASIVVDFLNRD